MQLRITHDNSKVVSLLLMGDPLLLTCPSPKIKSCFSSCEKAGPIELTLQIVTCKQDSIVM